MSLDRTEHRKLAAILFTDMVGYPDASGAQHNEVVALNLLDEHGRILRERIGLSCPDDCFRDSTMLPSPR